MGEKTGQIQKASATHYLLIFILGLVVGIISELHLAVRALLAVILGIIYSFFVVRRHFKQFIVSRRTGIIMIIIFVVVIILIGSLALISRFSLANAMFLVGWLILMIIFIRFAQTLPYASVLLKSILTGVAVVSLGAAISIGGVAFFNIPPVPPMVQLTIYNNCNTQLVYEPLGIAVPAYDSQTIKVPPGTVTVRQENGQLFVYAFGLELHTYLPENIDISFDGRLIEPGIPLRIKLREREAHELIITCR